MPGPAKDGVEQLSAARAGSVQALGQALEACRGYLLLIAQRELDPGLQAKGGASDLVQETLMDALRDFARFHGQTEAELRTWLRQLLLHNLVDFARHFREAHKRQIDREVPLDAGDSSAELGGKLQINAPSPSGQAIEDEQYRAIERALLRLPEDYQFVLKLRFEEDLSFEEIGRVMTLTPNAARKLWARACKRLQRESEGLQ
jgi:RNA polymerase sigma-70 factor (ECF subfamily)